ncbi:RsmB/NOP family class I SAM-dependent RNA methyltransferase [Nonomuraea sp. NPDC050663]|uniref:RsmB/NOP family class I SAM-dependent RNA methyltransferase n=1 Tax=Nonomuraea sp. NPDC050663 TaxID=3364370 RepID=UPI00379DB13D
MERSPGGSGERRRQGQRSGGSGQPSSGSGQRGGGSGQRSGGFKQGGGGSGQRGGARRPGKPVRDEARNAAYDLLRAVDERDAYANLLMPRLLRDRGLGGRDAALATELAYGTLRGLGSYDKIIATCVDRDPDPEVLDALRLGAHQLLRMRVPPHAAVGTTVDLVRLRIGQGAAKFVNAVLRKIAARTIDEWLPIVAPSKEADLLGHLAVTYSHPRWVVAAFRDALGDDARLPELLEADNARPTVTLVARPGRSDVAELEESGAEPGRYSPYAAYLPEGDPGRIPAVAAYRAAVQDEASQLVALALARVPLEGSDRLWLDMCAGPGGKAGLLDAIAAYGDEAGLEREKRASDGGSGGIRAFPGGAHLVAADSQHHRARLVWETTREAAVITADGTEPSWRQGVFDRVMLDAPCTGLGALRRRPEARWRRDARSVPDLTKLQRALLDSAVASLRPGGVLAYVTCSPHLAETRVVVSDVLKRHPELEQLDARAYLPEVGDLGPGPHAQFWPHRHGTDAMFLAILRKTSKR